MCRPCRAVEPAPYGTRARVYSGFCAWCSAPIFWTAGEKRRRFCDLSCAASYGGTIRGLDPVERANRRAAYRRKRRAAGVVSEPYTLAEIAKRDGWCCGECRRRIIPGIAWPDRWSATIDHIIPLSRGGNDTRANVQLCHAACNSEKGGRLAGVGRSTLTP